MEEVVKRALGYYSEAKNNEAHTHVIYTAKEDRKINDELLGLLKQEQIGLYIYNPNSESILNEYYSVPYNDNKIDLFGEMLLRTTIDISKKAYE